MARRVPVGVLREVILEADDPNCPECGRRMHVRSCRRRRIYSWNGPLLLNGKLTHCPDPKCLHRRTFGPERELTLSMPRWLVGWDVFCWMGHRRFARHWSVPIIRDELWDRYGIALSDDAIEDYLQKYQCMLAARQQDFGRMKREYAQARHLILSIDGLQPEKGHETLYVVRELGREQVWFATPLLSSATGEIRPLVQRAKDLAERLGRSVRMWMSDKQDAFVKTIAELFPGVPHGYCANHFLRDLAKPALELDGHAKVQMRRKIRGLRAIEREVLQASADGKTPKDGRRGRVAVVRGTAADGRDLILDYCAGVRGMVNDNQGGPLHPPGLRMSESLDEMRRSLGRNLRLKKGGSSRGT